MPKRPVQPEDLLRLVTLGDPQIAPDGQRILFCRKSVGERNQVVAQLWTVDMDRRLKQWTFAESSATQGRWSPDGGAIAFVAKREGAADQVYVLSSAGGEARALTQLPEGTIGELRWSPNSKRIAFLFRESDTERTSEAIRDRAEKGRSDPPRITESARYRLDGDGYFMDRRFAVFVADVKTGEHTRVFGGCPNDGYSFDWSPDSKRLAVVRSMASNPWRDPVDDRVFLVDVESGRHEEVAGLPTGEKHTLRWSPHGRLLAYFGNDDPADHRGVKNTKLFVAPLSGRARCLTGHTDYCFDTMTLSDAGEAPAPFLEWTPDSKHLLAKVGFFGEEQLAKIEAASGRLSLVTEGQHRVIPGPPSADGRSLGCLVSDPVTPAEIAYLNLSSPAPYPETLTEFNADLVAELDLVEPVEAFIPSSDGCKVHAWVLQPPLSAPGAGAAKRPAILEIHGGPHAQYGWCFFFEFQVLASAGFAVVYSNPRGSKGYGEASTRAIEGHWGGKDWEDVAAVKDWIKAQPWADASRLGVIGGSYGGYMVNWVIGHTNDFRAAVTDRCVSNLVSKALNSDYAYHHGTYWAGHPYGDARSIADLWRDSPMAYFDCVNTPTLIIHSEGDLRCNIEQAEQVFFALQERGIPSRFVRYPPTTSHGMSRAGPPDLRVHRLHQILSWWKEWL